MTEELITYQVRLYGHVTGDRDVFIRKMAVLLEISPAQMNEVMLDLPAVVKRNITQRTAEFLKEQCTDFGGLCLAEPMEGEAAHSSLNSLQPQEVMERVKESWHEWGSDSRARIYFVLLVAAIALFSTIVTVGYSVSVVKIFRESNPVITDSPGSHPSQRASSKYSAAELDKADSVDLSIKKSELETQLTSLRFQYDVANRGLQDVSRSTTVDRREVFERSREVVDLRNRIREVYSRIQQIENRLHPGHRSI